MDNVPRVVERRARGVGMQVCKQADNSARNGVVGEQWAGKDDAIIDMGLKMTLIPNFGDHPACKRGF
jgi:hypothetical protein